MPSPKEILAPDAAALAVQWDDGHESFYRGPMLRRLCPCAECRVPQSEGGGSLRLVSSDSDARHRIANYHPVGNYALGIRWADGHSTGIYTFDYLRGICPCGECSPGGAEEG